MSVAALGGVVLVAMSSARIVFDSPPLSENAVKAVELPEILDEGQREYLWEIEHQGLVLSRHGFTRLADGLSQNDRSALAALLAPEFAGQTLRDPREVRVANEYVNVVRQEDGGQPAASLTTEQFIDGLLSYRKLFSRPPKVQMSLMTLAPVSRGDFDSLWQGRCQLRMWGETSPGQPGEVVLQLQYQLPRPTEQTLRSDGWLQTCAITQSQVARSPRFLLREVAQERGIDCRRFHDNWEHGMRGTTTGGVYLCDYNRDGLLDILVADLNCIALYKGLPGGKFVDVTLETGLPWKLLNPTGPNLAAAFVDLDGDGWEDLILNKQIYRNEQGRRFTDVTSRSNLSLQGDISGFAIADYDRDGRLDLYVARLGPSRASSWLDGKCGGQGGNLLFRNKGDWQFEEVAAASGATGGDRSTFSAVWFDANNDGWPDLYVINEFGSGVLLLNQGNGTFREQVLVSGPGDFGSMGVTAGDIDNDGNVDLYVANMYSKAGSRVIGNLAPGTYADSLTATLRSFVAGSQLHRNLGARGQVSASSRQWAVGGEQQAVGGEHNEGTDRFGTDSRHRDVVAPRPTVHSLQLIFEQLGPKYQVSAVGWAYGPALVDLDNDGWLDLYATAGFVSQNRNEPDG
jgi:hypothetical protein